jgi:DNA-binding transcriptional LysR family regulator
LILLARFVRLELIIMTLDQLRIFIAVAEREHLTRAAEALNLTPSAVSAAIHALETRYGVHLFHRIGRRIELSQTGRLFLVEAKRRNEARGLRSWP